MRGCAARAGADPGALRCAACDSEWEIALPVFMCPACGLPVAEVASGDEFEVESIEVEEAECIAPVRVVEEALDANNTIAQANRADFDRAALRRTS